MRITRSIIPNLFTLANLFCGFTAIINIAEGEILRGALFILAGGFFDTFDGIMARLTRSSSEFGVELDSLCDAVSFGVAPAFMLYKVHFFQYGEIGILWASFPALAGIARLARFNVQVTNFEDKNYFKGMPIPGAAVTLCSYVLFFHLSNFIPDDFKPISIFTVTIITSIVMISNIRFDNMPRPSKRSITQRPVFSILFIIALIASIASAGKLVFPFMMLYILVMSLRHFILWLKETHAAVADVDESEEAEPNPFDL